VAGQVCQVLPELLVQLAALDLQVILDSQVLVETQDRLVLLVTRDPRDTLDRRDFRDSLVYRVLLDHRVDRGSRVQLAILVSLERLVLPVQLDPLVQLARRGQAA
jgi:hypothetical protein